MLFHKYQNTSQLGNFFDQPKCIIRPENVAIMTIHGPLTMYKGERITSVDKDIGFIRFLIFWFFGTISQVLQTLSKCGAESFSGSPRKNDETCSIQHSTSGAVDWEKPDGKYIEPSQIGIRYCWCDVWGKDENVQHWKCYGALLNRETRPVH